MRDSGSALEVFFDWSGGDLTCGMVWSIDALGCAENSMSSSVGLGRAGAVLMASVAIVDEQLAAVEDSCRRADGGVLEY